MKSVNNFLSAAKMKIRFQRKWFINAYCLLFFVIQCEKGKFHGSVDTGLSVIACKKKGRRIDVDADDLIYHLKVRNSYCFCFLCKRGVMV